MERRLTTILAADVVGYSRLMEADEERTLARLKAHRAECIDKFVWEHSGRIFKTMGDGFLVEFASVVEAVRCAIEIQTAIDKRNRNEPEDRRIIFRIGINLGDVIIEGGDIYGNGVNVAARVENLADPGGIAVSAKVRDELMSASRLEVTLEDLGRARVKNIKRPVRVFRVLTGVEQFDASKRARRLAGLFPPKVAIVALLVIVIGAAAGFSWWRLVAPDVNVATGQKPLVQPSGKPTVAVLPFANLSGEVENDYFSDGLTEDITNALGRYQSLAVMAYGAALPFKAQLIGLEEIGKRLDVRYLVEGSVRRSGNRVRVATRLTDAQGGILLWSGQFDEQGKDIFTIQDAITRQVAGTLVANLTRVEQDRAFARPTEVLDAYDLVLRGRAELGKAKRGANRTARRLFERAKELDGDYADAYAWLARAYYQMATDGWTEFPGEALQKAEELTKKAIALNPETVEGYRTLSRVHAIQFQLERAMTEIAQALKLNPSDAEAYGDRGLILLWASEPESAVVALDTAFSLNPNLRGDYVFARGLAYYTLQRHRKAIEVLERGAALHADYVFIRAVLVAAYGQIGQLDDAQRNVEAVRHLLPFFDASAFGRRFRDPSHYEYLSDGLRKGGLL